MQSQISWLLQRPTDLDLRCLQGRVYPGSAGQGLKCDFLIHFIISYIVHTITQIKMWLTYILYTITQIKIFYFFYRILTTPQRSGCYDVQLFIFYIRVREIKPQFLLYLFNKTRVPSPSNFVGDWNFSQCINLDKRNCTLRHENKEFLEQLVNLCSIGVIPIVIKLLLRHLKATTVATSKQHCDDVMCLLYRSQQQYVLLLHKKQYRTLLTAVH